MADQRRCRVEPWQAEPWYTCEAILCLDQESSLVEPVLDESITQDSVIEGSRIDSLHPEGIMGTEQTHWFENPTRLMFFTGKGGVGKTSLACAVAVRLADLGKRVLLVSTDPASNLGQVFQQEIGELEPTAIVTVKGLDALNINPESAAQAYRDRIVGPVRGLLPEDVVRGMEEQLSGGCTTEIAAFDEFTGLLSNDRATERYDHILFDTAPTGHTLRLLQLPTAWSQFLDSNTSGASCLGPLSGLEKHREQYSRAVAQLADGTTTTLVLVARPLQSALAEASRTSHELTALGIENQRLIVNGVFPDHQGSDPIAIALRQRQLRAIAALPSDLASLPITYVELKPNNMVGTQALRALLSSRSLPTSTPVQCPTVSRVEFPPLLSLVESLASENHGMIMVLGKGGVGKTTIAAAIAVGLASRGHDVHLTTTDPAAHLAFSVESNFPNLYVDRIDPQVERERYRQHVLQTKGKELDPSGLALLEEDLRSPCTEEIAVFQAFSRVLLESRKKFVVVDTAPTGHTLLLLDATGAYHREVVRHQQVSGHVVTPMMRLQDPQQTKMLIVTLPETTPVLEAELLQSDLRRAGIEPWAWVINSSFAAASPSDPLLVARAASEVEHIDRVRKVSHRLALVPFQPSDPSGSEQLLKLASS